MAVTIELQSCALQIRRIVGTTAEGKNKLSSLTFDGVSNEATGATLLGVSNAVASLIPDTVANVYRNDKSLINPGE